jgi:hypothetical protein
MRLEEGEDGGNLRSEFQLIWKILNWMPVRRTVQIDAELRGEVREVNQSQSRRWVY